MYKSSKDIKVNFGPMGSVPEVLKNEPTLRDIEIYNYLSGSQSIQSQEHFNSSFKNFDRNEGFKPSYPLIYIKIKNFVEFINSGVVFERMFNIIGLYPNPHAVWGDQGVNRVPSADLCVFCLLKYMGCLENTDIAIFSVWGDGGEYNPNKYFTEQINTLKKCYTLEFRNNDTGRKFDIVKIIDENKIFDEVDILIDCNITGQDTYRLKFKIPVSNKYESEVLQNFINVLKEDTKMYSLDNVKPCENIVVRKKEDTQTPVLRDCEEYQVVKVNPNTITLKVLGENILTLNGVHFIDGDVFTVVKDEFLYHYDIVDIVKEEIILPTVEGYGSYIIKIGVDGGFRGVKNEKYVLYDLNAIDSKGYWELRYLGKTRIIGHSLFELLGTRHSNNYSYHEANVTILDFFKNTDVPSLPVISPFSKNEDGKYTVGKNYNKILNYGTIDLIDSNQEQIQ